MKDDFAFAGLIFAVLVAIVGVLAIVRMDAGTAAKPAVQEVRYMEPITVIGRPEALADESVASAEQEQANAARKATGER